jgi:vancomycin permeability regulator SanA
MGAVGAKASYQWPHGQDVAPSRPAAIVSSNMGVANSLNPQGAAGVDTAPARSYRSAMTTGLILGAAVWPDGPSPALQRRVLHAAGLYHAGRISHLIPCGGLGLYPPTEAQAMADLLRSTGIPAGHITLEDRSSTTFENLRYALPLLTGPDVVIVTDRYHAPRAAMVARHFGLNATLSCPSLKGSHLGQQVRSGLREIPALMLYWWKLRRLTPTAPDAK